MKRLFRKRQDTFVSTDDPGDSGRPYLSGVKELFRFKPGQAPEPGEKTPWRDFIEKLLGDSGTRRQNRRLVSENRQMFDELVSASKKHGFNGVLLLESERDGPFYVKHFERDMVGVLDVFEGGKPKDIENDFVRSEGRFIFNYVYLQPAAFRNLAFVRDCDPSLYRDGVATVLEHEGAHKTVHRPGDPGEEATVDEQALRSRFGARWNRKMPKVLDHLASGILLNHILKTPVDEQVKEARLYGGRSNPVRTLGGWRNHFLKILPEDQVTALEAKMESRYGQYLDNVAKRMAL